MGRNRRHSVAAVRAGLQPAIRRPTSGRQPVSANRPSVHPSPRSSSIAIPQAEFQAIMASLSSALERSRHPPMRPFNGNEDIEDWLDEYEHRGAIAGWDAAAYSRHLRMHLVDAALTWYRAMTRTSGFGDMEWAQLKKAIVKAFKPRSHLMQLAFKLKRDQDANETLVHFFDRRRLECHKLGMDEDSTILNIVTHLREDAASKLSRKPISSLDALREKLQDLHEYGDRRELVASGRDTDEDSNKKETGKKDIDCWRCGRRGHRALQCRVQQGEIQEVESE